MKKLLIGLCTCFALSSFASLPATTHLGCALYTGEAKVFYDLRKFSISTADEAGERVLSDFNDKEGTCSDLESGEGLVCNYANSNDKEIVITLDEFSTSKDLDSGK